MQERTLLNSINDIKIDRLIETPAETGPPVKLFHKNSQQHYIVNSQQAAATASKKQSTKGKKGHVEKTIEPTPAAGRDPADFIEMDGTGDQILFDDGDRYPGGTMRAGAPQV